MTVKILTLAPSITGFFGDTENARVFSWRLRWADVPHELYKAEAGDSIDVQPDLVIIGSTSDSQVPDLGDAMRPWKADIAGFIADDIPILALGAGWELLGESVPTCAGTLHPGLSILPITSTTADRVVDELVLRRNGKTLFGFQNTGRVVSGVETPFAEVVHGRGNQPDSKHEGQRYGSVYATSLQGPIAAKNPEFADELLSIACARQGHEYVRADKADIADSAALGAKNRVLKLLSLPLETSN